MKKHSLTEGKVLKGLILFALPMMAGNLIQQVYNIVDTLIVGRFVGSAALAGVGSSYSLMTFLTSVIIGLCMGSGALFSMDFGAEDFKLFKKDLWHSFFFIGLVTLLLYAIVYPGTDRILSLLSVPSEVWPFMRVYVRICFIGLVFIFLFNFFAYVARSLGNSMLPLVVLVLSSALNIILDLYMVLVLKMGVAGAALATVISQGFSAVCISVFVLTLSGDLLPDRESVRPDLKRLAEIIENDLFTAMQQSVMNFGILMIQGLVNSFGTVIMAAFAASVKIDTIAYMPAQEFGSAFSLFISQNKGAGKHDRIMEGTKKAVICSAVFCTIISFLIFLSAGRLMGIFVDPSEGQVIFEGVRYLRIEGACYMGIGILFLMYGYFRGIGKPFWSLILTIISLGSRVLIAYSLSGLYGVTVIWWAIPIGWGLADLAGFLLIVFFEKRRVK